MAVMVRPASAEGRCARTLPSAGSSDMSTLCHLDESPHHGWRLTYLRDDGEEDHVLNVLHIMISNTVLTAMTHDTNTQLHSNVRCER